MEEQQHQQQQQQAKEEVLKKLRSEVWSPYANTSNPSGAHSPADLEAVSKAASKAAPPFNLAGALTTAAQSQYQRNTAKCFRTCFSEMLQTEAPAPKVSSRQRSRSHSTTRRNFINRRCSYACVGSTV
jgi:hypothetical protein